MRQPATKRIWAIGGTIGVALLIIFFVIRNGAQTAIQSTAISVQYTDAITGNSVQDLPLEHSQTLGIPATTAAINGSDALNSYLTSTQVVSTTDILSKYLLAHSGLANIQSGIKDNKIIQVNSHTIQFTLIVVRPAITYSVSVHTSGQTQTVPSIDIIPQENK